MLDDIRKLLEGIMVTAGDIFSEIDKKWFSLFLDDNGFKAAKKLEKYEILSTKLARIGINLATVKDDINK